MAIINVDYLRRELLIFAKTEERRDEINLALAGLHNEIELFDTSEIASILGIARYTVVSRSSKLRKHGYQLGIKTRARTRLYLPGDIELIRNYKELVGAPTKTAS